MSTVDLLAELLFIEFQKKFPLRDDKSSVAAAKNLSHKSIEQRLSQFYEEAREARKKHRLWPIGWARVVFKLQQRMLLAGHPPALVSKLLLPLLFSSHNAK
jgi:hypothetical protein